MGREVDSDVEGWVYGRCYVAALALHRVTGWQIASLTAVRHESRGPQMAHAWVVDPDGNYWDAGGKFTMQDLEEIFLDRENARTRSSAKVEIYQDEDGYMSRLSELSGSFWEKDRKWLEESLPLAETAIGELVLPRYPEIARATEVEVVPAPF